MGRTMSNKFAQFLNIREEKDESPVEGITAYIKLQKKTGSREFTPFYIDKNHNRNMAPIVAAFSRSANVTVGYTTIQKNKGEIEPTLSKKQLYLTGGAVRDHLMGKTPDNYDLVTDATPSEIRMILSQNGFLEVQPKNSVSVKYKNLPLAGKKSSIFYASRWDRDHKEMEFTIEVNGQPFTISTLSKGPKSKNVIPDKSEPAGSIEEDAANRDFTINAMYIHLKNEDGPNSELIDPFGGANDLKNGEMKAIGNRFDDRLQEDPMTAMRFINHFNRFGKGDLPDAYSKSIAAHKDFSNPSTAKLKDMFVGGIEHPDVDPRQYLASMHKTGMLERLFPGIHFNPDEMPEGLRGDRWMSVAWILRNNSPEDVRDLLLSGGWNRQEANDIAYLVKMYQWAGKNFDPDHFYDLIQTHTGLTRNKIKDWMVMANTHSYKVDNFLNFDGGDLNPYRTDDCGVRKINPVYVQILGRSPMGNEFETIKRMLLTDRWKDLNSKL